MSLERSNWYNLIHHRRGTAALEFAIAAPVMVTFLIGTIELANAFRVQAKVNTAAGQLAELIARQQSVTAPNGSLADFCKGAGFNIIPYNTGALSADIASVSNDHPSNRVSGSKDTTSVSTYLDWENVSSCSTSSPSSMGTAGAIALVSSPTSLLTQTGSGGSALANGYSAIVVRVTYRYGNVMSFLLGQTIPLSATAVARPRTNVTIKCTNPAGTAACP